MARPVPPTIRNNYELLADVDITSLWELCRGLPGSIRVYSNTALQDVDGEHLHRRGLVGYNFAYAARRYSEIVRRGNLSGADGFMSGVYGENNESTAS
jgi:hypothetical protein